MSYFQIKLDVNSNILVCQELIMLKEYHDGYKYHGTVIVCRAPQELFMLKKYHDGYKYHGIVIFCRAEIVVITV